LLTPIAKSNCDLEANSLWISRVAWK
jgi:hypothetical protein